MNDTLVNTKTSLEPLVLTSLSKLLPRLLTINKIDESEFQPFAFFFSTGHLSISSIY